METKGYRERIIDAKLQLYLESFGAVLIEGPKWCGKTWSGKHASRSAFMLADPKGNFNNRQIALVDPSVALDGEKPRLIDEWQEVPSLWDAIRGDVDQSGEKGQYILTGSATINKNQYIHTGTGRIAHLRMRPMSLFESGKSDGKVSLYDICKGTAKGCMTGDISLIKIIELILVGGWPSSLSLDFNHSLLLPQEYAKTFINEDIDKVDDVKRNKHKVELLLRSISRNEATTVTNTTLKRDISEKDCDDINIDSITDYLKLFKRLYLIENIPPFSTNIRSSLRVKQNEKRHFVDPSLPCAFLSLTKEKLLNDLELLGFLFESMVERDLLTYVDSFNGKLFHYQDYNNNEIDTVIELENGDWCGFDIKLGANQIDQAAKNLLKVNEDIRKAGGKPAKELCVICGLSNACYKRTDGVYVVPITSLKN